MAGEVIKKTTLFRKKIIVNNKTRGLLIYSSLLSIHQLFLYPSTSKTEKAAYKESF